MKWFKNMKIGSKLILCFVLVAFIAGIVGGIGIRNISIIDDNDTFLYKDITIPIAKASEMSRTFQDVRVINRDMILSSDQEEIKLLYQGIQEDIKILNTLCDAFVTSINTKEIQDAYDHFLSTRAAYAADLELLLQLCLENRDGEAYELLTNQMQVSADNEQGAIDNLVNLKVAEAELQSVQNSATAQRSILIMIIVIAAGMLVAVILGIVISRVIGGPIRKLSCAAELIADGNLNIDLDISSKDEIGALAGAFQRMSDNLNSIMTNINIAADQVASGSRQVSEASIALSQGATEQASAIEELSSSLEEISVQTVKNAENANQANSLAEAAKENANTGNEQMKEMLKAMDEINESSNNISKIIKVIDDIAFQTNILALNAAVEAARAGQHGKGFAVVAEEVRNLAARSAKAAKETTGMIEGSIKKVDGGTKIANQTANALSKIVGDISKVADLVANISNASNEQATGIAQVNQGVIQVSNVVQTNSATSQESAAASEELSSQAELLKEQVYRFKLKRQGAESNYKLEDNLNPEVIRMLERRSKGSNKSLMEDSLDNHTAGRIKLNDNEFGKYL